jgi:hypothetical protein
VRTILGPLAQIQLARQCAPDLVEWTTTIAGPDMSAARRADRMREGLSPEQIAEAERQDEHRARFALRSTQWR